MVFSAPKNPFTKTRLSPFAQQNEHIFLLPFFCQQFFCHLCFIACVAERPHRWLMRRASHFDGDDTKLFRPDGLDTVNLKFKETL